MSQLTQPNADTLALRQELQNFNRFAEEKLQQNGYITLEELLGLWRANHPLREDKPKSGAYTRTS